MFSAACITAARHALVVYCLRKTAPVTSRLGLTFLSAKLGHTVEAQPHAPPACVEVYRLHEAELLPGYDIVIVARGRASQTNAGVSDARGGRA